MSKYVRIKYEILYIKYLFFNDFNTFVHRMLEEINLCIKENIISLKEKM